MHSVMYDEKKSTHEKTGQMLNNCTRRGGKNPKINNKKWIEAWESLRKKILLLKHIVKALIIHSVSSSRGCPPEAFGYKMPLVDGVEPSSSMSGEWASCTLCFRPQGHLIAHYS